MKDSLCSYYTNSEDITSYMVSRLGINENDIILEPSAGEGIFIDELLKTGKTIHVDALDIDEHAVSVLYKKYENNPNISVRKTDTLFDAELDSYDAMQLWLKQTDTLIDEQLNCFGSKGGHYTKVIGNPPYGAWQDYEKREILKKKYAGQYVKETYSLFLLRCISVLKNHGRLTFIIPDTFLFLNLHAKLREVILTKTKINEILIFPSKFFPGVNFGYSNLSIITLERCEKEEAISNTIRIIKGFQSSNEFAQILSGTLCSKHLNIFSLKQKNILNNPQYRFIMGDDTNVSLLNSGNKTLGDVSDIVTGFYTGNNKKFICALNESVKGSKGYSLINKDKISECTSNDGIDVVEGYVPYIKSASKRRYLRERDEWFVRWDKPTINFYHSDRKARFQNSAFYFKTGVGIPMVKSSFIRAFLMKDRVFDQSIVGIFPHNNDDLFYFLALMNSEIINKLIHIINPTANNSANYVKQLPYIEPPAEKKIEIIALVEKILLLLEQNKEKESLSIQGEINSLINEIYSCR